MNEHNILVPTLEGTHIPATLVAEEKLGSRACILSHGIFVSRSENGRFDRLGQRLSFAGVPNIRFDLSGHGESETPSIRSTVAGMADEIAYVYGTLRAQGASEIDIVASSFSGALLSILMATKSELAFSKVIFLNPVLDFDNVFLSPEMPEMAELFSPERISGALKTGAFYPVPHFCMSRAFLLEMMSIDLPRLYASIEQAHLVLHGASDELVSIQRTRQIVKRNGNSTWIEVAGAKHAFNTAEHEEIAHRHVIDWLMA